MDDRCEHIETSWVDCGTCDGEGCDNCFQVGAVMVCENCDHTLDETEYDYERVREIQAQEDTYG